MIITDHPIGVHSIRQEDGEDFEVSLLPTPDIDSRASKNTASHKTKSNRFGRLSKTKKQKKDNNKNRTEAVYFDEEADVQLIRHKSEIAPEEKALLWVNYYDWQATQKERFQVARAVLAGHLTMENQTEQLFLRGLESAIPQVAAKRRETVNFARTLVLREQSRARLLDRTLDDDHLAWCYGSACQESRGKAYAQGLEDYHQVLEDDGVRRLSDIV